MTGIVRKTHSAIEDAVVCNHNLSVLATAVYAYVCTYPQGYGDINSKDIADRFGIPSMAVMDEIYAELSAVGGVMEQALEGE